MSIVQNIVKAKITSEDIGAYKAQAKKMKTGAEDEPGTLVYDFFINENTKDVLILEQYANSEAFMAHMKKFTQPEYIPTLMQMMEIGSIDMPGLVSDDIKEFFAEGGWQYNAYPLTM
jgi:quinol monooxygenase YgiN